VICSIGRVGGQITVDDGVVRMLLEYRICSDRPVGFGRYHSPRPSALDTKTFLAGPSEVLTDFFWLGHEGNRPAACFEFGERRALA
jgi:hypothetical protein